ncbi:Uncharacterized protein FWK35_00009960 [Aphis craccivora]|uniref:Uncharacterized protein n=1 Tax=Aphis craccivora TaxID=307492 RepID=A0A6G0YFS3_APHCR|nr:Uncharacterized protein FWK35_00009960 [Aphis craccivora]
MHCAGHRRQPHSRSGCGENMIDMNHKYLMVYTRFDNEYLEFDEVLTVECVLRQNKSNPKYSTVFHHFNAFILITSILHFELNTDINKCNYKKTFMKWTSKNIIFREPDNKNKAHEYFINYENPVINKILSGSQLITRNEW